jgi:D-3-phosphoglycerate dehydrogenase / 2-oxoglutarate reductase
MELENARLLVTPTSYGKNDPRLKTELEAVVGEVIYNPTGKPLSSAEVAALLPGIDGYIAGLDEIDAAALQNANQLKVIARYGVGVDKVDLGGSQTSLGITVTNTPGANSVSVAELALGLMLALARQILPGDAAVHQGKWPRLNGISLEGKTVGIVGLGAIGRQLARRLGGFDCRILAFDPCPDTAFAENYRIELCALPDLLLKSDFVSLHMPLLADTRGMVDSIFLEKMKQGSFLINTSRGEVIDEDALLLALQSGHLRGAALDAFTWNRPTQHPRC